MALLQIKDLHVTINEKEILRGVSLTLESGKVNALMGPNGSGKSTLANVLMGHPKYKITKGQIIFDGKDITNMEPHQRARLGLFLSFQYPAEITGVTVTSFLRAAVNAVHPERKMSVLEFRKLIDEKIKTLNIDKKFLDRYLNEGFSGGEKKRSEILQLCVMNPRLAILDETDSGLDIDALRTVSAGINTFMNKDKCILIITHYKRILEYVKPDKLFILLEGKIALEGKGDLVDQLEEKGYGWITKE